MFHTTELSQWTDANPSGWNQRYAPDNAPAINECSLLGTRLELVPCVTPLNACSMGCFALHICFYWIVQQMWTWLCFGFCPFLSSSNALLPSTEQLFPFSIHFIPFPLYSASYSDFFFFFPYECKTQVEGSRNWWSIFLNVTTVPGMDFVKGMCDISGCDSKQDQGMS